MHASMICFFYSKKESLGLRYARNPPQNPQRRMETLIMVTREDAGGDTHYIHYIHYNT